MIQPTPRLQHVETEDSSARVRVYIALRAILDPAPRCLLCGGSKDAIVHNAHFVSPRHHDYEV